MEDDQVNRPPGSPPPSEPSAEAVPSPTQNEPVPVTPGAPSGPAVAQPTPPDSSELGVAPGARLCGNCRLFKPVIQQAGGWMGDCRVMRDRGMFPATAPVCNSFLARAAPVPRSLKTTAPTNVVSRPRLNIAPMVRSAREEPGAERHDDSPIPELENMTREELKAIIREALGETDARIAPRWEGGTMVLKSANGAVQPKEIPLDSLFHKVVMVRDRLRVLEQKLNAHPKLSDAEKVEMQQYVTKCYGSLTTFNVLFADKDDQFIGEKGKTE